jgi:hypothetical protein
MDPAQRSAALRFMEFLLMDPHPGPLPRLHPMTSQSPRKIAAA